MSADYSNWDTIPPFVTFAYNSAVQHRTEHSSFRLLFGRKAAMLFDTLFLGLRDIPFHEYPGSLVDRAESARQLARSCTSNRQKVQSDAHLRPFSYNIGDLAGIWFSHR